MRLGSPEDVIALTPQNPYDRTEDGRPRVLDDILKRMELVTLEEAWGVLRRNGYHWQFEGDWVNMHPDRAMVGRVITAVFTPIRPDLNDVVNTTGEAEDRHGSQNNWVIHTVGEGDVIVADLFGKLRDGTFVGDNLSNAIQGAGGRGLVVNGGVRDTARIYELDDFNVYCRGYDPTAIRDMTLISLNGPARMGQATAMPGDIVLGARGGIIFIPPHLAEEVVVSSENVRLRDVFGHQRLREGKYSSGEIDTQWSPQIEEDFENWKRERGE